MITSEKIRGMIGKFERVLPYARHEGAVDMDEGGVSRRVASSLGNAHKCGTTHCHAGWYLLACEWDGVSDYLKGSGVSFEVGAHRMMRDTGMRPEGLVGSLSGGLVEWAEDNPEIWGNPWGEDMFFCERAFGCTKDNITLEKIVDHWRGVAARLKAKEEK